MIDRRGYRANIGIVLCNDHQQVFWGKRIGAKDAWQFAQGGIQPKETLRQAMYRELGEELGLSIEDIEILATSKNWYYYDLPKRFIRHDSKPLCIGQKQKWFLLKLRVADDAICLDRSHTPEFDGWRWVDYWYPLQEVIAFKRKVYKKVLEEFAPFVLN